jgi:hypothetical protein
MLVKISETCYCWKRETLRCNLQSKTASTQPPPKLLQELFEKFKSGIAKHVCQQNAWPSTAWSCHHIRGSRESGFLHLWHEYEQPQLQNSVDQLNFCLHLNRHETQEPGYFQIKLEECVTRIYSLTVWQFSMNSITSALVQWEINLHLLTSKVSISRWVTYFTYLNAVCAV